MDIRIIAATNRDLPQEMTRGRFRKDLFYRLAVLTVETPPLRKRPTDIPLLIHHFMREAEGKIKCAQKHEIEPDALVALSNYGWPGNVRELRHVVERLVATTMGGKINLEAVAEAMSDTPLFAETAHVPLMLFENDTLDAFLDRSIIAVYQQLMAKTGNHSEAARLLGLHRTTLYQRLERARKRMRERGEVVELPKNGDSNSIGRDR